MLQERDKGLSPVLRNKNIGTTEMVEHPATQAVLISLIPQPARLRPDVFCKSAAGAAYAVVLT